MDMLGVKIVGQKLSKHEIAITEFVLSIVVHHYA